MLTHSEDRNLFSLPGDFDFIWGLSVRFYQSHWVYFLLFIKYSINYSRALMIFNDSRAFQKEMERKEQETGNPVYDGRLKLCMKDEIPI